MKSWCSRALRPKGPEPAHTFFSILCFCTVLFSFSALHAAETETRSQKHAVTVKADATVGGGGLSLSGPKVVIVTAQAASAEGLTRLAVFSGRRKVASTVRKTPAPQLSITSPVMVFKNTTLCARSLSASGETVQSRLITCTVGTPESWKQKTPALLSVHPFTSEVVIGTRQTIPFVLNCPRDLRGTLFIVPGDSRFRAVPSEIPLELMRGDTPSGEIAFPTPESSRFPAQLAVVFTTNGEETARGTLTFMPWKAEHLTLEGTAELQKQGNRIGLIAADLLFRIKEAAHPPAFPLTLKCVSSGFPNTGLRVTISMPPPRRPLVFTRMLPAKRGRHTVRCETADNLLRTGAWIEITSTTEHKVLLTGASFAQRP